MIVLQEEYNDTQPLTLVHVQHSRAGRPMGHLWIGGTRATADPGRLRGNGIKVLQCAGGGAQQGLIGH